MFMVKKLKTFTIQKNGIFKTLNLDNLICNKKILKGVTFYIFNDCIFLIINLYFCWALKDFKKKKILHIKRNYWFSALIQIKTETFYYLIKTIHLSNIYLLEFYCKI